jgi:hypothetical protein
MIITQYERMVAGLHPIPHDLAPQKKRRGFKPKYYEFDGKEYTLEELAIMSPLDITSDAIYRRIERSGMTVQEAITEPDVRAWAARNRKRKPRRKAA